MYIPHSVLVPEMVSGQREFVSGLSRDPQLGPCVMFGLGGIFTEIIGDVNFRVALLNKQDVVRQIRQIKIKKILEGVRGMQAVDIEAMADILIAVGKIGLDNKNIKEIE